MKKGRSTNGTNGNRKSRSKTSSQQTRNGNSRSASSKSKAPSRSSGRPINQTWLKDFLSEMLAVEEGGQKLYDKAISELQHDELRDKLEEFAEETRRHVELVSEMMQTAGIEEGYMSPGAEAAEHKAEGLLSTEVEEELRDLNNIENLVLAETKDHWDWETLKSIVGRIQDRDLKDLARDAVAEVFKQENEHLQWNQDTLTELAMEMSQQPDPDEDTDSERSLSKER